METCLLGLALFPEVQKKAQAELDRVVGSSRLPEFDDLENLPYLHAVLLEALRWLPVTPFGVPHRGIADDEYRGYHIPAGSVMIPVRVPNASCRIILWILTVVVEYLVRAINPGNESYLIPFSLGR